MISSRYVSHGKVPWAEMPPPSSRHHLQRTAKRDSLGRSIGVEDFQGKAPPSHRAGQMHAARSLNKHYTDLVRLLLHLHLRTLPMAPRCCEPTSHNEQSHASNTRFILRLSSPRNADECAVHRIGDCE
ncbi:unnamed protein product [Diplocarpon coronariae]|nr:hypothetical protein JHW43_006885 [Diplocarpon mali]